MSSINDGALITTLEVCPKGEGIMVEFTCGPERT
jgi:hypothetical protein